MDKEIFVVCDRNVEPLAARIADGRPLLAITADEEHKTIDTVADICRWLMEQGADRKAVVYAVGGGVTTDLVGFAASVYKRGVSYVNYPTTLLCQVDAGIGGKTGVNLDSYKNMMGVTRFPADTRILPDALKTLPARELRSGAAEMLKTFIIEDKGNYEQAVKVLSAGSLDFAALHRLALSAADVKRRIVEKDPFEEGPRRKLNRAAEISERLGLAAPGLAARLRQDFTACGLPVDLPCPEAELESAIWKDKKVENGRIHFVLIRKIGKVTIEDLDDLHKFTE